MRPKRPLIERFVQYIAVSNGCWEWIGALDRQGYGAFGIRPNEMGFGYPSYDRMIGAHRIAYYLAHGTMPPCVHLDHICHSSNPSCKGGLTCPHRRCVNPNHLQIVTPSQNSRRTVNSPSAINGLKTHCIHGHPFDPGNTYIDGLGKRHCRTCRRNSARERRKRERSSM